MKTELLQAINAIVQRMPTVTVRDDTGLWTPNTETDIYAQLVTLREDTLPGHRCQAYSWNFETQEFRLKAPRQTAAPQVPASTTETMVEALHSQSPTSIPPHPGHGDEHLLCLPLNCQDRDRPIPIGCMVLSMSMK